MANLETDIIPTVNSIAIKVTPAVFKDMLKMNDLDAREIISLVFLMADENTNFYKVLEEVKKDPYTTFEKIPITINLWQQKLVESLLNIGNKYVLTKMGFDKKEIQILDIFFADTRYLNEAVKSLYFLCESLDKNDTKKLIDKVNTKLAKSSDVNPDKIYLELHILEWLEQRYISVNPDKFDLHNLYESLNAVGCLIKLPKLNFLDWDIKNIVDNRCGQDLLMYSQTSENNRLQNHNNDQSIPRTKANLQWFSPNHLKLLIIINQIEFTNEEKFPSRKAGSIEDEANLERAFKSFGFEIKTYRNQTKQKMIELLESLNSNSYCRYGAIFMCILSHGLKGEVVFTDDNCISLDIIKNKFCCRKLKNVLKFVILEACRGGQKGTVEKPVGKLVIDGHSTNPHRYAHFGLFHATVEGFVAMRDTEQGSWLIQALCQEIQKVNKQIELKELIIKVKRAVWQMRGNQRNNPLEYTVQLTELLWDTIMHPYELIKNAKN